MGKKILLAFSMAALIITIVILYVSDAGGTAGVRVADNKKIEKLKAGSVLTDLDFSLCFEGERLPYDAGSQTFFLPVDMESESWEEGLLDGYFLETAGEDEQQLFSEIFFREDFRQCSKKKAIAEGQAFSFLALSKKGYREYKLVFSGLPMLTFHGTEYTADDGSQMFGLTLYDTDHTADWIKTCYTAARLRGNTSLTYEKKSLRLYLKELKKDGTFEKKNLSLLGLRDDDDWILNALYADNSRIRDQLCIDLWKDVGAGSNPYGYSYGTDCALTEVFINDNYQGLYGLMVPIDAKQLGLLSVSEQYGTDADVIERIYKKKYTSEWVASDFVGELPDDNMPDYRGGFYLKGDMVLKNEEEWLPLYRLASLSEAEDSVFSNELTLYNDKQNLVENWLFYQAVAGFDNQNKNYYYVVKNKNGREYGYFIPWDLNISFGMVYAENIYYSEDDMSVVNKPVVWEPGQRMLELDVDNSRELLRDTWKRWRRTVFSDEAITERIEGLEHRVKDSGAFAREEARYPDGNQNEDFSYIYDFTKKRMAFVDAFINELTR